MHYHAEVFLPADHSLDRAAVEATVAAILAPFSEEEEANKRKLWDWYQIGGRWTGAHDPSYNPEKDPRNIKRCHLCAGTGFRADDLGKEFRAQDPSYTCNGCGQYNKETSTWEHGPNGAGWSTRWPTQWVPAECDIMSITNVPDDLTAGLLFVNGDAYQSEVWTGKKFAEGPLNDTTVKAFLAQLGITAGLLVTVDCHS